MTPREAYDRFLEKGRKTITFHPGGRHAMMVLRVGLYALRKRNKEKFYISQELESLTISDEKLKG